MRRKIVGVALSAALLMSMSVPCAMASSEEDTILSDYYPEDIIEAMDEGYKKA